MMKSTTIFWLVLCLGYRTLTSRNKGMKNMVKRLFWNHHVKPHESDAVSNHALRQTTTSMSQEFSKGLVNGLFHLLQKWDKDRVNFFHDLLTFDLNPIPFRPLPIGISISMDLPKHRISISGALILARNENWEMLASPGKLHGCPTCPGEKMDLPRDKCGSTTRKRTPGNRENRSPPEKREVSMEFPGSLNRW